MKQKLFSIALVIALLCGLVACINEPAFKPGIKCANALTIRQSETFYFLEGVTAVDANNESITHKITIKTSEGAAEVDGKLVFEDLGIYTVEYTVYDAAAYKTYNATTVITVVAD